MADKAETTEEEAFELFQKALRGGQDSLDRLSPEVKSMAMGPAEKSLGGWEKPAWADLSDPSSEGYDPIVSPPEPKTPEAEGYEPIVEPPKEPGPSKEFKSREEYKGFRAPKGMSPEQLDSWKEGIDDRLLDEDERLQERIGSAHPADQMKDLLRRASEGDLEAMKDIGYFGLNVASMSPVGQLGQAVADIGVGGMDLAEGDYTGAAISGAAVVLPISAVAMKKLMKHNSTQVKLIEDALQKGDISEEQFNKEIRELIPNQGPMRNEDYDEMGKVLSQKPSGDMSDLEKMLRQGFDPETFRIRGRNITDVKHRELLRQFRDELAAEGNKNLQRNPDKYYYTGKEAIDANLPISGVDAFKKNEAAEQEYFRSKGRGVYEPEKSSPKFGLSNQGHHNVVEDLGPLLPEDRALLDTFAGKYGLNELELRQLRDEYVAYGYDDFPGRSARGFDEIPIPESFGAATVLPISAGMAKQIMNRDFGDKARDFFTNYNQIGYEIEQALIKSQGKVTDSIQELKEYRKYLGDNVMKSIQDADDIAPISKAQLDDDLMSATGHTLDEIIEAAKQGKTLPTKDEMLYKAAQHRSTDPWEPGY